MKIVKVGIIPPSTKTGEFRYAQHLIQGFNEKGLDFEVLKKPVLINRPNIKIFLGSLLLEKYLKDKNISIIHNLDNLGPFLKKQDFNGIKSVQTIFDIAPVIFPEIHNFIMKFNFKYILPRLIKNSDSLIVSSQSTKEDLISYFGTPPDKINVIYLGVDRSVFYPREPDEKILRKYGIANNYLMYVGNDNPRKNLKTLILAYSQIFREIDQDLVLIGPINQENLTKIIKGQDINRSEELLNRIILPGYVEFEDLPILYSGASAFVLPSLYEGFGLPLLEAMACGTPVIASNNSSLQEVAGDAGLLIDDPRNPQQISEKILDITEDSELREKYKNRGLLQVEKFRWDLTVEKTIEVYKNVTG